MHVFVSAGEPSGDLHGSNLIRAIRATHPGARIASFGGPKMRAAGAEVLYPLTDLAVMWFGRVLAHLPTFFRVAKQAEDASNKAFDTFKKDAEATAFEITQLFDNIPIIGANAGERNFKLEKLDEAFKESVGFFSENVLKRLDLGGAAPQNLAPAENALGGTWNTDGTIVYARSNSASESTGVPSKGSSRWSSTHACGPMYSSLTFTVTGRGIL